MIELKKISKSQKRIVPPSGTGKQGKIILGISSPCFPDLPVAAIQFLNPRENGIRKISAIFSKCHISLEIYYINSIFQQIITHFSLIKFVAYNSPECYLSSLNANSM